MARDAGTGQPIPFSARPDRIVGAGSTPTVLDGLGVPADTPPNAAPVAETAPGETDAAVVEPFAPRDDPVGQRVTYEGETPETWETSTERGCHAAPADPATLAPSFGAAHLFIDGCPSSPLVCLNPNLTQPVVGTIDDSEHDGWCWSAQDIECLPCRPWKTGTAMFDYWMGVCDRQFDACQGACEVTASS